MQICNACTFIYLELFVSLHCKLSIDVLLSPSLLDVLAKIKVQEYLFVKINAFVVLPAHRPLILDAGTVLVSVQLLICASLV